MIGMDWTNPDQMVSQYFSVKEVLWLNHWGRLATEADGLTADVKENLLAFCALLDQIREYLGEPMIVTSFFRPIMYNKSQGIKPEKDVHSMGRAVDFHCPITLVANVQARLRPVLDKYKIRMEHGTSTWVHIDNYTVGPSGREFRV